MITDHLIFKESGQYDKEVIQRLRIQRSGITSMANLERCVSLQDLDLSYNEISAISGLDTLSSLQRLNLSHNRIFKIENVSSLTSLESLELKGNHIRELSDISILQQLPNLRTLSLRGVDGEDANPLCSRPDYPGCVLSLLPGLEVLDGGHSYILNAFTAMNHQIEANSNENTGSTEEALAPEPWFSTQDLQAVCDLAALSDMDRFLKSKPHLAATCESIAQVSAMLSQDGGALIRKATLAMSSASR